MQSSVGVGKQLRNVIKEKKNMEIPKLHNIKNPK
jgi:hypothetical protein